jgi:hypothetical protein
VSSRGEARWYDGSAPLDELLVAALTKESVAVLFNHLIEAADNLQLEDPDELQRLSLRIFPDGDDFAPTALILYLEKKRPDQKKLELLNLVTMECGNPLSFGDPDNAEAVINALGTVLELRELVGLGLP